MFNNQHLLQHIDRQPNVILVIIESNHEKVQVYNKLSTVDIFVVAGVTLLEVRMYASSTGSEPQRVSTFVNPIKWELVAQPDPEGLD